MRANMLGVASAVLGLAGDVAVACEDADAKTEGALAADLQWTHDSQGGVELHAHVDPALSWHIEARARFGTLRLDWSQPPVVVAADGDILVALEPPEGVFLHPLAADYVTTVGVRLVGERADGRQVVYRAPVAYLAWPDGPDAAYVQWDEAEREANAPHGIVSTAVRAAVGDTDADLVAPPLWRSEPPDDSDGAPEGQ